MKNHKSAYNGGGDDGAGGGVRVRVASTVTGSGSSLSHTSSSSSQPPQRRMSLIPAGVPSKRPAGVTTPAPAPGALRAATTNNLGMTNTTQSGAAAASNGSPGAGRLKATKAVTTKITATPVTLAGGNVTLKPKLKQDKKKPPPSSGGKSAIAIGAAKMSTATAADGPKKLNRISTAKFDDHKAADPFATQKKFKTAFALDYSLGRIPCRINHGSVKHKLQWDKNPAELDYSLLLPSMAEGLSETEHPYVFVARTGFREMLLTAGAGAKTAAVLGKLIIPLRKAVASPNADIFQAGLEAIGYVSNCVGPAMNEHLPIILVQISKKLFDKKYKTDISNLIGLLIQNGGDDAVAIVKAKVPSFSTM